MRVDTVSFATRIRLPDGRHETTISMQNHHQKQAYEVTVDTKQAIITITSIRGDKWITIVPMANCTFINLADNKPAPRRRVPVHASEAPTEPPKTPVLTRKARPRVTAKAAG